MSKLEIQVWVYAVLVLSPLTLWHPTLIRVLCPSMPVEGAEGCCKLLVATEAWRDGGLASGVPAGPPVLEASRRGRGGAVLRKKKKKIGGGQGGRGVLGRRSEFSGELLGLSGVSEGSLFSSEAVVVELAVAGVTTSGGVSFVGEAWELG